MDSPLASKNFQAPCPWFPVPLPAHAAYCDSSKTASSVFQRRCYFNCSLIQALHLFLAWMVGVDSFNGLADSKLQRDVGQSLCQQRRHWRSYKLVWFKDQQTAAPSWHLPGFVLMAASLSRPAGRTCQLKLQMTRTPTPPSSPRQESHIQRPASKPNGIKRWRGNSRERNDSADNKWKTETCLFPVLPIGIPSRSAAPRTTFMS